ncbi:MAG: hypothetical protein AAGD25_33500 [Cyanobacteria bacterium P01_F01_bin.150]
MANPITFLQGNIQHANDYMSDVCGLLKLYQQHYPDPPAVIKEEANAIDLPFLQKDFQCLLQSMRTGSDRIQHIVTSLRTFARLDESEFKAVDINAGIDSTLALLHTSLQGQAEHADIQVIKNYAPLSLVEYYAGQLNQVFMNILRNGDRSPNRQRNPSRTN